MKITVISHDVEAGESFCVDVFHGSDPKALKMEVRQFVSHRILAIREEYGCETRDAYEENEKSGLVQDHQWRELSLNESWKLFDPASEDNLHYEFNTGSERLRIIVFADKQNIVKSHGSQAKEEDAAPEFHNYYECPECKHKWDDVWEGQPDDDCPKCGCRHISPYQSEDV